MLLISNRMMSRFIACLIIALICVLVYLLIEYDAVQSSLQWV